jgi:hypothetical protein
VVRVFSQQGGSPNNAIAALIDDRVSSRVYWVRHTSNTRSVRSPEYVATNSPKKLCPLLCPNAVRVVGKSSHWGTVRPPIPFSDHIDNIARQYAVVDRESPDVMAVNRRVVGSSPSASTNSNPMQSVELLCRNNGSKWFRTVRFHPTKYWGRLPLGIRSRGPRGAAGIAAYHTKVMVRT